MKKGMFNFKNCFGANQECDVSSAQPTPVVLYQRIQQIQQEQIGNK